jgi:hypothetical protein
MSRVNFDEILSHVPLNGEHKTCRSKGPAPTHAVFANLLTEEGTRRVRIALPLNVIRNNLLELTSGWPKRVGDLLFVRGTDNKPLWLDTVDALFAWTGGVIPRRRIANPVTWARGDDRVSRGEFFSYLRQTAEEFQSVEAFPHHPEQPRTYYMHEQPRGGSGADLRKLIRRFNPLAPVDHDLIQAFFLTLCWGGACGQRPAWLFTTDDDADPLKGRGTGKSALAKAGAYLVGGLIQASPRDEMAKLITRLLTPAARTKRVVLLDNLKTLKFSWAELEAQITADVVSGHQMYEGEGQRPNWLIWCLTVNGASLSRDMAQRTVVIKVKRPEYSATWEDETRALIDRRRWHIIGDCLALLKKPGKRLPRYTRWGAWEAGVLSRVADPSECQKVIAERQGEMDDDAGEAAIVREAFRAELILRGHQPDVAACWIAAAEAAGIVNSATGERFPVNRAGVYLRTLAIPELLKSDINGQRGWAWRGLESSPEDALTDL